MIEQTELLVIEWHYHSPSVSIEPKDIQSFTGLDVMQKRASTKKGLAVKLSARFVFENKTILDYVAEHSYVIDFEDVMDKYELQKMIRNSFSQFNEKFEMRKLNTVL